MLDVIPGACNRGDDPHATAACGEPEPKGVSRPTPGRACFMDKSTPTFSIILPAYNEAGNVAAVTSRLLETMAPVKDGFEIIWVNDGSVDGTEAVLDSLAAAEPRVRALHFSRNFGHMAALCAGLEAARASGAVICMDADGQHPPELLPELIRRWREGADIVQTLRRSSPDDGIVKGVTSRGFYRVLSLLADIELPSGAADFRLMDRQAVDALNNLPEHVRFVRGLVHWIGFNRVYVEYDPVARLSGKTKYSLVKMARLAFDGLTSFSVRPLRLSFVLALAVIVIAGCYSVFVLGAYYAGIALTPGWASTLLVMMLLGSAQLFAIGIASEYLARTYTEQKQRPVYILRKPRGSRDPVE